MQLPYNYLQLLPRDIFRAFRGAVSGPQDEQRPGITCPHPGFGCRLCALPSFLTLRTRVGIIQSTSDKWSWKPHLSTHSQAAPSRCFRVNIPGLGWQDVGALAVRVSFIHERFGQGALAEESVDGRDLHVSIIGNDDALEVLPITEMVFDKRRSRPEERIATQFAKWEPMAD